MSYSKRLLGAVMAAGIATIATAGGASAAEQLGCKSVGFLADRDVIPVGRKDGKFTAIKLKVSKNTIELIDLKVIYGNGNPDDLPVRSIIKAGGETRWIDLKGGKRVIKQIEMIYKSKPSFKGQAKVCAFGK